MYLSNEGGEELINQQLAENKYSPPLISIYRKLSSDYVLCTLTKPNVIIQSQVKGSNTGARKQ